MDIAGYNMPEELYYDIYHFWTKVEGDLLVMGMDDFARKLAGEIVYVQLPDPGKKVKLGQVFAKVESGKWLGKIVRWYYSHTPGHIAQQESGNKAAGSDMAMPLMDLPEHLPTDINYEHYIDAATKLLSVTGVST